MRSRLCFWDIFFFLLSFLAGSTVSSRGGANFKSLNLDFSERGESL